MLRDADVDVDRISPGCQAGVDVPASLMDLKGGLYRIDRIGTAIKPLKNDHQPVPGGLVDLPVGAVNGIDKTGKNLFDHMADLTIPPAGAQLGVPFDVQKQDRHLFFLLDLVELLGIFLDNGADGLGNKGGELGQHPADPDLFPGHLPVFLCI